MGCLGLWPMEVWRNQKAATDRDISIVHPPLQMLTKDELDFCLCRFICEVRKTDGAEYPGKTCYEIVTSIQKYFEMNGKCFKLLSDKDFKQFQLTLDSEMKGKACEGVNKPVKQTSFIDDDKEDKLWKTNTQGDDSTVKLLHTVLYLAGINFCARGRTDLRNLTYGQVKVEVDGEGKRLCYQQITSGKNNQGSLKRTKDNQQKTDALEVYVQIMVESPLPTTLSLADSIRGYLEESPTMWDKITSLRKSS